MSQQNSSEAKHDPAVITEALENGCYLDLFNDQAEALEKVANFSHWISGIGRWQLVQHSQKEDCTALIMGLIKTLAFIYSDLIEAPQPKRSVSCVCGQDVALLNLEHLEEELLLNQDDESSVIESPTQSSNPDSLNSFKFNFVVKYDERIENLLYPVSLVKSANYRDKTPEYTIQKSGPTRGVCLLCPCPLGLKNRPFRLTKISIQGHVSGQRHLKNAATPANLTALSLYHDFWRAQDTPLQAHQAFFMPEEAGVFFCVLCSSFNEIRDVVGHIKGPKHKRLVLAMFETDSKDFYLNDLQVGVYGVEVERPNEESNGADNAAVPKCVFTKCVLDASTQFLPDRFKEHRAFLSLVGDEIVCEPCKVGVGLEGGLVKNHVLSALHKKTLPGMIYAKYDYFCEICNAHFKSEEAWDEHHYKGPNRHGGIAESRKPKVCEYECRTCLVVIFGDELSLTRHITTRSSKGRKKVVVVLPYSAKKLLKSKAAIAEEGQRLQSEASLVLQCPNNMTACCADLEKALSELYPASKAHAFGSRISGVGNHRSDLDVFMDVGDMYLGNKNQDSESQERIVRHVAKLLKSKTFKGRFGNVVGIPAARTPIVKVHHCETRLDCDISFRHGLGCENTKFLGFCMDLQPITQALVLMLKKWSDMCSINEHITNYALALMAVFYLQTGGFLLPVTTIRDHNPEQALIIDGWDTINYSSAAEKMKQFVSSYTLNLSELLRGFFFYFSNFDYANDVVCPLLGRTIPKSLFQDDGKALPSEMGVYVQRIQNEKGEQFRSLSFFCVQDPFDLSHNLTKACQHGTVAKFKTLCTLTYEMLDSIE